MEELIDFIIDVFSNVWKKFKVNAALIIAGGVLSAALVIPCLFSIFPPFSTKCIILRVILVIFTFIFIKICVFTVKGIEINLNTFKYLFQNLLKPLLFSTVMAVILGVFIFAAFIPLLFPAYTEKSYVVVFSASIVSAIVFLALLPNAIISLFFSYEGKSFGQALSAAEDIIKLGRGKMYFLTISLLLCALILNLTYVGMIVVFPLIMLAMDQSRESLVKLDEEKKRAQAVKQSKSYRPRVDYTKDYSSNSQDNGYTATEAAVPVSKKVYAPPPQEQPQREPVQQARRPEEEIKKEEVKSVKPGLGLGGVFKANVDGKGAEKNAREADAAQEPPEQEKPMFSKIVSKTEYGNGPKNEPETNRREEEISLSDFIDVSYEKDENEETENSIDGHNGRRAETGEDDIEIEIERDIKIEFEHGERGEFKTQRETKTGKDYIDEFGTLKKKKVIPKSQADPEKRAENAKKYIENFGVIKKKK